MRIARDVACATRWSLGARELKTGDLEEKSMKTGFLLFAAAAGLVLRVDSAFAGSATWLLTPSSGDWNAPSNWTPGGPPDGPTDTATFRFSTVSDVSISVNTQVSGITFAAGGATPYEITAGPGLTFSISGTGVINNSGLIQNFVAAANTGVIRFANSASAGFNTTFTTNGSAVSGAFGGMTEFFKTSNAGSGTFISNGGAVSGAGSGVTLFFNNSSAGNGTFTDNGGLALLAQGGVTQFFDRSSAGHGVFTVNGGAASGGNGAVIQFFNSSSAANGIFTTNGGAVSGEGGGTIEFHDSSSVGSGIFTTNGITANDAAPGETKFYDRSSAGHAMFITNGGGNNGAGGGGVTSFHDSSNAGNASFTTNGSTRSDGSGGTIEFRDSSSAGRGTFITNGSAFRTISNAFEHPQAEGVILFLETATAGNGTLIANGGTNGGDGGLILFGADSTGGTARVGVFGNGRLDISNHDDPGLTVGSIEGTGMIFLGGNPLRVGSNNLSTNFSGVLQDGNPFGGGGIGGSLTKIGWGTLTLSSANTYTGNTVIEEGALIVDGSLVSADTFVNARGLLGGTGIIGGNVTNSGTVSPGHSPGTLIISGNYTQSASGTLQIEIAGRASSQHDLLAIGGSASLDGNLQLVRLANFAIPGGGKIIVLTAPEGVNGQFAVVENSFATSDTLLTANVIYEPNDVALFFTQGSFLIGGLTRNQTAVAQNIDKVANDARAATLIGFLDSEPVGNLPRAYDLIAPEELGSMYEIGFSQAGMQSINLQRRMDDIRAGSNGFSAAGYQMRDTHGFTKGVDGKAILEENAVPIMQPAPENRWGVFVTGAGQFVNVGDADENARGYDITTGDFTLGLDYRVCPNFAIGLDAGYARSDADLVNRGRVTVDGGKLGLYATWFSGGFYLDGAVGGGYNSYDTRRSELLGDARGSTNGAEFNGLIGGGYDLKCGGWSFGPVATFQYTYVSFDGFTEGGSLAPLDLPDQSEDSERSTLGLKASYDWKVGAVIVRQEVRTAWQHEFGDNSYPIDSRFASGAGGIFTVHGPEIGRDSALIDAGFAVLWNERISTYLYYDGQLGRANYTSHGISGDLRVSF